MVEPLWGFPESQERSPLFCISIFTKCEITTTYSSPSVRATNPQTNTYPSSPYCCCWNRRLQQEFPRSAGTETQTFTTCAFPRTEIFCSLCPTAHCCSHTAASTWVMSGKAISGTGLRAVDACRLQCRHTWKCFRNGDSRGLLLVQPMAEGMQSSDPDGRQPLHPKHVTNGASTWLCTIWDSKLVWRHSTCGSRFLCKCKILIFACANWVSLWEKAWHYMVSICDLPPPQSQVYRTFPDLAEAWSEGLKPRSLITGTILPTQRFSEILQHYLNNSNFSVWKMWPGAVCFSSSFVRACGLVCLRK